jgi:hypothetical protein
MGAEASRLALEADGAESRFHQLKKPLEVSFQAQPNDTHVATGKSAHARDVGGKGRYHNFAESLFHTSHLFFRHISQELDGDMHILRPNKTQTFRRDLALQASDSVKHLSWEVNGHKAPDAVHLRTLPLLAEVTEFL